jgi:hypothetical protein
MRRGDFLNLKKLTGAVALGLRIWMRDVQLNLGVT